MRMACQQLAYATLKVAHSRTPDKALPILADVKQHIDEVHSLIARTVRCKRV